MVEEALRLDRVSVRQEGITLLDSFSMRLFKSEILGLIPVNAQGLDELVNLVKSNSPVHYGYVWLSEHLVNDYRRPRKPENPVFILDAKGSLIDTMSVAENVFVVRDRMKKFLINRRVLNEQFTRLSTEVGLEIDPEAEAGTLSFFERKAVELIKALVLGTRIVVIRDLSNAASPDDLKGLMRIVRFYREKKKQTFLYICNDSEEAFSWCDRCVLMENGRIIKTLYSEQMTPEFLSRFPQGFQRYVNPGSLADDSETGGSQNPVFQISRLSFRTIRDLSLSLSGGECLVLMDLDHTLHESLTELLKGRSADESVTLEGQPFSRGREKMAFLDENPVRTSLFRDMSYLDNLCFPLDRKIPFFWTRRKFKRSIRQEYFKKVGPLIDMQSLYSLPPDECYKLIFHRISLQKPRVLVCVQPFSEVDLYQRQRIVELMNLLKKQGIALILLVYSLSDSPAVADQLILFRRGRIIRKLNKEDFYLYSSSPISKESPPK